MHETGERRARASVCIFAAVSVRHLDLLLSCRESCWAARTEAPVWAAGVGLRRPAIVALHPLTVL